jgi:hypothetical protein
MPDTTKQDLSEVTFDDIFNSEPTTTQEEPLVDTQAQPEGTPDFVLRTSTGTVYNSIEDAQRGTEEKDRLIESLRQRYIAERGIDPITNQPVRLQPQEEVNYLREPEKFYQDLEAANTNRDPRAFTQVQAKFMYDLFGPYLPILTQTAKAQAVDSVSNDFKDFREFIGSEGYSKYLDDRPVLKQAIKYAESDPQAASSLRDLYVLTYEGARGRNLPEIIKAAKTAQSTAPAPRPAMTNSTMAPPSTGAEPSLATSEGRKTIIDSFKSRGLDKVPLPF